MLILFGTHFPLFSALCQNGKSVLHLDSNDYYGGSASSANLEQSRIRWAHGSSKAIKSASSELVMAQVVADLSDLGVHATVGELTFIPLDSFPTTRVTASSPLSPEGVVVGTSRSARSYHPAVFDYIMERQDCALNSKDELASTVHPTFIGYRKDKVLTIQRALYRSRHFSLDENPRVLFSYGKMVDAMLTSGVNSYMEFVSIQGIYITRPNVSLGGGAPREAVGFDMVSVPCSKADVFKSKLLSGLEKRMLMKLLQLAVDYGNNLKGVKASYQNESTLVQGRALHRPQNTHEGREKDIAGMISDISLKDKTFSQFLNEFSFPAHLQDIVLYAICLLKTKDCSATEGLEFLYRHVYASGRLGETAFLYPIYGTTEIPESFCRSAAVRGAVYALRQNVIGLIVKNSALEEQSSEEKCALDQPCKAPPVVAVVLDGGKIMACEKLAIGAQDYWKPPKNQKSASIGQSQVTRVCVCTGNHLLNLSRGIAVLPPHTGRLDNKYPIFVLQLDSTAMICPQGCYVLYILTLTDGLLDEIDGVQVSVFMQQTLEFLQNMSAAGNAFNEIYFQTKISVYTADTAFAEFDPKQSDMSYSIRTPANVVVSQSCRRIHSIVMDEIVDQASGMLRTVYPGDGFFAGPIASPADTEADGEAQLLDV